MGVKREHHTHTGAVGYNKRGGVRLSKHRHRAETTPVRAIAEEVAARIGGVVVNTGPRVA
jgi:hypothetical protein